MGIRDIFKKAANKLDETKDPVCGMKVDLSKTEYKSEYLGKVYGFCSPGCKATFDENPKEYADSNL